MNKAINFMTGTSRNLLLILLLLSAPGSLLRAATPLQMQDIRVNIDEVGDARFTLTIQFEAVGFQVWKQTVGGDPALLKREIQRMFSAAELEQFAMERFDMDRKVTFTFTGRGAARYLGSGKWETLLEERPPDGTMTRRKLDDRTFFVTSTTEVPGIGIMQQDTTITLPEGTSDLRETESETAVPMLSYTVTRTEPEPGIPWQTAGISTLVLGLVLLVGGFALPKRP